MIELVILHCLYCLLDGFTKPLPAFSCCVKIDDIANQEWASEVKRNPLCVNYRIFKDPVCLPEYLSVLDNKGRISLWNLRCVNHRLPINSGRYVLTEKIGNAQFVTTPT